MVLDISTKYDMTEASLNKLTKTQVIFPKDVEDLTHRVKGIHALAVFFFKKSSFISQGLKKLVNFCLDNRMLLKTRIFMDEHFTAKFICAIDDRIYQWLKQCSTRESVIDTDISLIEFSSLISDIHFNRFSYFLPPSVQHVKPSTDSDVKRGGKDSLKKKRNNPVMMVNPAVVNDWKLRPSESWNTVFREKTVEGPSLSMLCKPCLKYHVKGLCYDDCKHKASHCALVGEDKKKTDDFIKSLRGE